MDKGLNINSVSDPFFFTLKSAANKLSSTFFPNNSLRNGTSLKFCSNILRVQKGPGSKVQLDQQAGHRNGHKKENVDLLFQNEQLP